jgi:hypothetical protein
MASWLDQRIRTTQINADAWALRPRCCPNTPARKVPRSIHERARDMARAIAKSWEGRASAQEGRNGVRSPQTHSQADRLRLRGPNDARDEFVLAATAQLGPSLKKGYRAV